MKDKAIDHRRFLASVAEWIRKHNEQPDQTRLANKHDLKQVHTLVTNRTIGGRFENPDMEFVYESDLGFQRWRVGRIQGGGGRSVRSNQKGYLEEKRKRDTFRIKLPTKGTWCTASLKIQAKAYSLKMLAESRVQH